MTDESIVVSPRSPLDLDAFLTMYPWPLRLLEHGEPVSELWHFDFECSPETLWPYISDTSRLNRALCLPTMVFEERDGVKYGQARYGGIKAAWIEEPWEWVAFRSMQSVRVFQRGYAHVVRGIFLLEPLAQGHTRYYAYFGIVPRGLIGRIWTALGVRSLRTDYRRAFDNLANELATRDARPTLLEAAAPELPVLTRARLAQLARRLEHALEAHVETTEPIARLVDYITTGDDMDLYRMQVPALARNWGIDERDLLITCLYATREGMLEMTWDVVCPHCRGVREEAQSLGDIPKMAVCEICNIDFTTDKEESIEISFQVHPSIRNIPKRFFCSSEPSLKNHIKVQQNLPPGAELAISCSFSPGRYRMRLRGQTHYRILDVARGERRSTIRWLASDDVDISCSPNETIVLINDTDEPHLFIIESMQWIDHALRPARLFSLQEFRDLFSEEYLASDVQLSIGTQCILFTDMVGSTRFYASQGDASAFAEIKKHFVILYSVVGRHRGAVVKTLGDAIMAAFASPVDAVRASKEMHDCFHRDSEDTPIRLRISLNVGPCIAVNFNSNVDFFGGTVNIAAKLQACAEAGEIAMTGDVYHTSEVRQYLDTQNVTLTESAYRSNALDEDIPVFCWSTFDLHRDHV